MKTRKTIILILLILPLFIFVGCGEKVNKEKWENAFDESNFENVCITVEEYCSGLAIVVQKQSGNIIFEQVLVADDERLDEPGAYGEKAENGRVFAYSYDEDIKKWYKSLGRSWDSVYSTLIDEIEFDTIKYYFENSVYNKDNKNYKYCFDDKSYMTISFKNNKLSEICYTETDGGYIEYYKRITFSDYGKVNLILPKVE